MAAKSWPEIKARRGDPKDTPQYRQELKALEVGRVVRGLRHRAHLSQKQLADRMDTTQPTVARWEAGLTVPTLATIRRLAKATDQRAYLVFTEDDLSVSEGVSAQIEIEA